MGHRDDALSRLREEQTRVRRRAQKLEDDLNALTRARRRESDDDEHDPEGETLSAQWSMRAGLLELARQDVRSAEDALRRHAEGSYGVCVVCAKRIPDGQLEARPFRAHCVACAQ